MTIPALVKQLFLFVAYASAVWITAYRGLEGNDALGLVSILLLVGGLVVLVYIAFLRRTVSIGAFSPFVAAALGLLGLAFGAVSAGEGIIGIVAGLVIGGGAAVISAVTAKRRRRRLRTIFISYRRADSGNIVGRIGERLGDRFGAENIFRDVDSIELGGRFREVIADAINHADAVLAIIGKHWLDLKDEQGQRRIDVEGDLVRLEIEAALAHPKLLVVPLTVNGADIPEPQELPESIRGLVSRNGGVVRDPPDFDSDIARLIRGLEQGAVVPWSRAASNRVSWPRIAAMVTILLIPLGGLLLEVFARDYRATNSAALSPDLTSVATAHGVGIGVRSRVRISDTTSGEIMRTLEVTGGPIWVVAWSPDGSQLAYGDQHGTVVVVDANGWQQQRRFEGSSGLVKQISWAPDGDRIATGDQNGTLRVWSVRENALSFMAHPHADNIEMVQWAPGGDLLASGSWDRTVAVTDASNGDLLHRIEGHTSFVNAVAWSADGTMLVSAALEPPYVLLWSRQKPDAVIELTGHRSAVDTLAWSPTAPLLASSGRDDTVRIWTESGTMKHILDARASVESADIAWSSDGKLLATAGDQGVIIWEADTGRRLQTWDADAGSFETRIVGWWRDSSRLVTRSSSDQSVKIWNVADGRLLATVRVSAFQALMDKLSTGF
jgi:WD40 repeat protein